MLFIKIPVILLLLQLLHNDNTTVLQNRLVDNIKYSNVSEESCRFKFLDIFHHLQKEQISNNITVFNTKGVTFVRSTEIPDFVLVEFSLIPTIRHLWGLGASLISTTTDVWNIISHKPRKLQYNDTFVTLRQNILVDKIKYSNVSEESCGFKFLDIFHYLETHRINDNFTLFNTNRVPFDRRTEVSDFVLVELPLIHTIRHLWSLGTNLISIKTEVWNIISHKPRKVQSNGAFVTERQTIFVDNIKYSNVSEEDDHFKFIGIFHHSQTDQFIDYFTLLNKKEVTFDSKTEIPDLVLVEFPLIPAIRHLWGLGTSLISTTAEVWNIISHKPRQAQSYGTFVTVRQKLDKIKYSNFSEECGHINFLDIVHHLQKDQISGNFNFINNKGVVSDRITDIPDFILVEFQLIPTIRHLWGLGTNLISNTTEVWNIISHQPSTLQSNDTFVTLRPNILVDNIKYSNVSEERCHFKFIDIFHHLETDQVSHNFTLFDTKEVNFNRSSEIPDLVSVKVTLIPPIPHLWGLGSNLTSTTTAEWNVASHKPEKQQSYDSYLLYLVESIHFTNAKARINSEIPDVIMAEFNLEKPSHDALGLTTTVANTFNDVWAIVSKTPPMQFNQTINSKTKAVKIQRENGYEYFSGNCGSVCPVVKGHAHPYFTVSWANSCDPGWVPYLEPKNPQHGVLTFAEWLCVEFTDNIAETYCQMSFFGKAIVHLLVSQCLCCFVLITVTIDTLLLRPSTTWQRQIWSQGNNIQNVLIVSLKPNSPNKVSHLRHQKLDAFSNRRIPRSICRIIAASATSLTKGKSRGTLICHIQQDLKCSRSVYVFITVNGALSVLDTLMPRNRSTKHYIGRNMDKGHFQRFLFTLMNWRFLRHPLRLRNHATQSLFRRKAILPPHDEIHIASTNHPITNDTHSVNAEIPYSTTRKKKCDKLTKEVKNPIHNKTTYAVIKDKIIEDVTLSMETDIAPDDARYSEAEKSRFQQWLYEAELEEKGPFVVKHDIHHRTIDDVNYEDKRFAYMDTFTPGMNVDKFMSWLDNTVLPDDIQIDARTHETHYVFDDRYKFRTHLMEK